ncbi:sugar phosphate nucleotidyltransferase [Peribacillus alkalitolerans]|uniref:sugar phosphate nucleotidyltransferase n=1 Tax=Peribacillus alkalitolerans TaxID=1550385 RepID=UPI0013D130A8|nr:sugar phosphate nucleotidyltransferase [Peribacillus alkalitolerans]
MSTKLLGVIDATTFHKSLKDLIGHRTLAALPFGGRYRLIDFVLSSMVNSGISSVGVFSKYNYRSLMDHLGSGKNWDLNRKKDGLFFFPAPIFDVPVEQIGAFHHFGYHMNYFKRSMQEHVVVANCYSVFNMDFNEVLERHIQNGCDITELTKDDSSLEIYLLKRELLIELIETKDETGYTCIKDVIEDDNHDYVSCSYQYHEFFVKIDSVESYYQTSLDLLEPEVWRQLFRKNHPVYTKVKDEPPTHYGKDAIIKNSMVANGCIIEGHVENSIISRGVKINKGSIIKNCIVMQKTHIGENCYLDSVIMDKDVKIEDSVEIIPIRPGRPTVIKKGVIQGALMNT